MNGSQAARQLARLLARPASGGPDARAVGQRDLCVVTLWRLSHGENDGAAPAITRLRSRAPGESPASLTTATVCAVLLEAKLAAASAGANAAVRWIAWTPSWGAGLADSGMARPSRSP